MAYQWTITGASIRTPKLWPLSLYTVMPDPNLSSFIWSVADLLYLVTEKFATIDLHPDAVSNAQMGAVFEELIRKFAELSNETAGEHFTPREVIRLMVNLLFPSAVRQSVTNGHQLQTGSRSVSKLVTNCYQLNSRAFCPGQPVTRRYQLNTLPNPRDLIPLS